MSWASWASWDHTLFGPVAGKLLVRNEAPPELLRVGIELEVGVRCPLVPNVVKRLHGSPQGAACRQHAAFLHQNRRGGRRPEAKIQVGKPRVPVLGTGAGSAARHHGHVARCPTGRRRRPHGRAPGPANMERGACSTPSPDVVVAGAGGAHGRARQRGGAPPAAPDHPRQDALRDGNADRGPWLVSFALWANVLQYLDDEGTDGGGSAGRGPAPVGSSWAGCGVGGTSSSRRPTVQPLRNPPQDEAIVRAQKGRPRAQDVWAALPPVIDDRWRERLGGRPSTGWSGRSGRSSTGCPSNRRPIFPSSIPPRAASRGAPSPCAHDGGGRPARRHAVPAPQRRAAGLHGRVRVRLADLPAHQRQHPARSSTDSGTRVSDLPPASPASRGKPTPCASDGWNATAASSADRTRRRAGARSSDSRRRVRRRSRTAQRTLGDTEEAWRTTYGSRHVDELRAALEDVVGDGTLASSPLAAGPCAPPRQLASPGPARPRHCPHHPMVLHRGGYPDGS